MGLVDRHFVATENSVSNMRFIAKLVAFDASDWDDRARPGTTGIHASLVRP